MNDEETKEFSIEAEDFILLLDLFSENVFASPSIIDYQRGGWVLARGAWASTLTLKGILKLIEIGDYVDCFLLLRKVRDNLLFDCWCIYTAEKWSLEHHPNSGSNTLGSEGVSEEFMAHLADLASEQHADRSKNRIREWSKGKPEDANKWIGYTAFFEALDKYENIHHANGLGIGGIAKRLNAILNDYAHSNTMGTLVNNPERQRQYLGLISECAKGIRYMFVTYIMLIKSSLFRSSDYTDYLDAGLIPPEGLQYLIAPVVQITVDEIASSHPKLFAFLKEHNTDAMKLDHE